MLACLVDCAGPEIDIVRTVMQHGTQLVEAEVVCWAAGARRARPLQRRERRVRRSVLFRVHLEPYSDPHGLGERLEWLDEPQGAAQ